MEKENKRGILFVIFVLIVIGFAASAFLGYREYSQKEIMKQELNLNGLFINIKGVEIDTTNGEFFSEKPYKDITIKIPSIASTGDDATKENDDQVNQILDREKLDKGFSTWLVNTFDQDFASIYTDKVQVWYRDHKIIDFSSYDEK